MPDLNYDNSKVTKEMDKVTTFWLKEVGVDGFRLDAAKHLVEDGAKQENTTATHEWFMDFRKTYKRANPEAIMVGELSGDTPQTIADYTSGDQIDLAFNFSLAAAYINAANRGQSTYVTDALKYSLKALPTGQYSPFLTNHDQDRAMSQLYGEVDKAKLAASLLLTSPGVPFLYYGEEIGMVGKKPDENIRRPMQWSDAANAGFSGGKPWRPVEAGYPEVNVAAQADDPASLLSHYRALIAIRNAHPALRMGSLTFLPTGKTSVYALLRMQGDDKILVLINLDAKPYNDYALDWAASGLTMGTALTPLMGTPDSSTVSAQPVTELAPFTTYIFVIK